MPDPRPDVAVKCDLIVAVRELLTRGYEEDHVAAMFVDAVETGGPFEDDIEFHRGRRA